jgi:hypothetical protein
MQGHDKLPRELATRPGTERKLKPGFVALLSQLRKRVGATIIAPFYRPLSSSNECQTEKLREEPWLARAIADIYDAKEGLGQRS